MQTPQTSPPPTRLPRSIPGASKDELATGFFDSMDDKTSQRFLANVDPQGPTPDQEKDFYRGLGACHLWTGTKDREGYGRFSINGKRFQSHRIAYQKMHGKISREIIILHRCDNPSCVNPFHLAAGSVQDNVADRDAKNRGSWSKGISHGSKTMPESRPKGSRNGTAKLTEGDVIALRADYATGFATQKSLAAFYGVSQTTVYNIVNRRKWVHI